MRNFCVNAEINPFRLDSERDFVKSTSMEHAPVGSYVASMTRESSALLMCELLVKWEANGDMPPIHELKDANGINTTLMRVECANGLRRSGVATQTSALLQKRTRAHKRNVRNNRSIFFKFVQ